MRLVNEAVPLSELKARTRELATLLRGKNPTVMRGTKMAVRMVQEMPWEVSNDYLFAKSAESQFHDPERGRSQGLTQFLDERAIVPACRVTSDRSNSCRSVGFCVLAVWRSLAHLPHEARLGAGVLANLERFRFGNPLHLVNPRYDRIGERPCVRSISELPDGIDCAVLAIPQAHVADAVRACAEKRSAD